jgi:S-DNA-T family DNA segregation ATPase FtsK/SpoIIIE
VKIKLTLVRPGEDRVDLAVIAEPTTTIADIARELHNADPKRSGEVLTESGQVTLRLHGNKNAVLEAQATIAESELASGMTVSLAPASTAKAGQASDTAAVLRVISGADAGKRFELPAGSATIGRDPSNRVVLSDPLVSKQHARLNIADRVEIIDGRSANGTLVNDLVVDRAPLAADDRIQLGDTVVAIELLARSASAPSVGSVDFNRSPRLVPRYEGSSMPAPEVPERPGRQKPPWLALFAPLVMGGVILIISPNNPVSIVFIALSPLLLLGGYLDARFQASRAWKQAQRQFDAALSSATTDLRARHDEERAARLAEAPTAGDVVVGAAKRSPVLWTRRPEHESFLQVRLGLGDADSRTTVDAPTARNGAPELWTRVQTFIGDSRRIDDVPIIEQLGTSGSIGVAGPLDSARSVARAIVSQLVGMHSPAELVVISVCSTTSAPVWDWLKWLPHASSAFSPVKAMGLSTGGPAGTGLISELDQLIAQREEIRKQLTDPDAVQLPVVIVVVEDDATVERARLVRLAERGPAAGVHMIWVAPSLERIPAACRTFVELAAGEGDTTAGFVHTGESVRPLQPESLSTEDALAFARDLSPVVDAGARVEDSSDLPRSMSLLQVLGTDVASDTQVIIDRWKETNSILTGPQASAEPGRTRASLRAVFGQAAAEPFALDLRADGPHALVGGTTGSGKSEFLQAWVLALASAHSPDRVTFLFVDYKGGSAFADCVDLPHSVGLVTDLTPHLVRRALTSLRAEVKHRERLFKRHKVKDIHEFETSGEPGVPPSLIIVIDEFAALASEVPHFVDGVVDIAQRGRSLGLHLIMATQRPAGVIRDNLRANTNLRVALRMADETDSDDVLGSTIAAGFDPSLPGRAAAKTGPGRVRVFQSGYAGGWTSDEAVPSRVEAEELTFGVPSVWQSPPDPVAEERQRRIAEGPTDIERMVGTIRRAARDVEITEPRRPWLPELAEAYDSSKLPNKRTDAELVIGVADDAESQSQPIVSYLPDRDGNMAIIGTGGAGKSTALRSVAVAAALTARGGPVHVYGLDFGAGGLQMLETLPHVGAIINGDDDERVARLLRWLRDVVDERADRYAAARASTIVEYRKLANAQDEPRIVLLLDGMAAFREAYEVTTYSGWFSLFSQIATDGRPVGVHVVVTGDRLGAIPPSLSSSIQRRLVLRMANVDDYSMLGVDGDVLGAQSPAGRGILDDREVQVAVLGGDPNVAVQSRELDKLAEAMRNAGVPSAPTIDRLPETVSLRALKHTAGGPIAIGIADDTLSPIAIDPTGTFMIAGPPASGRTTAIATIATALELAGSKAERILISPRRSPLSGMPVWKTAADNLDAAGELIRNLVDRFSKGDHLPGEVAVFLENVTDFADGDYDREVEALIRVLAKSDQFVVAEGETSTWQGAYGIARPVRAGRKGLILQPDDGDDDLLKADFGRLRRTAMPAGRGFLVAGNRSRKLQVAIDEDIR